MALSDDEQPHEQPPGTSNSSLRPRDIFKIPAPVRRLFDQFPFVTYPSNELPQRSPVSREIPTLYIFAIPKEAEDGAPSFNPSCLKWQAYLKFAGINFRTVSSNNHASPTGALPFLLPGKTTLPASPDSLLPIPSNKLQKWVLEQNPSLEEPSTSKYAPYLSLLDCRIRNAWLYNLYLKPVHFSTIVHRLYVRPSSSNPLIQATISNQLRAAAEAEILKTSSIIDAKILFYEADGALQALETLLGEDDWFFGAKQPGLFDASVFAYVFLILNTRLEWEDESLRFRVGMKTGLIRHCWTISNNYFGRERI